jgi:replicative DNA helicase
MAAQQEHAQDLCTCSPNVEYVELPLVDIEHQLLSTIIAEPWMLEHVPGLEVDDFTRPQHRVIFEAIRNLEARLEAITVASLDGYMVALDLVRGTVCRLHCGRQYIGALLRTDSTPSAARTPQRVRAWAGLLRRERHEREVLARRREGEIERGSTEP